MTADSARLDHLVRCIQSGDATPEEQAEWLRLKIADEEERLRKTELEIGSALERNKVKAVSDLRERLAGLAGAELIKAGHRLWRDFQKQWGDEAAREAWKAVQPPRRQGRKEWQEIPPKLPRCYHTSDLAHFQRASKSNRAALLATQPTGKGGTLSKVKAARAVLGEQAADPARHFRPRKARRPIRD